MKSTLFIISSWRIGQWYKALNTEQSCVWQLFLATNGVLLFFLHMAELVISIIVLSAIQ